MYARLRKTTALYIRIRMFLPNLDPADFGIQDKNRLRIAWNGKKSFFAPYDLPSESNFLFQSFYLKIAKNHSKREKKIGNNLLPYPPDPNQSYGSGSAWQFYLSLDPDPQKNADQHTLKKRVIESRL